MLRLIPFLGLLFLTLPTTLFAWGGGHDLIGQLLGEYLPQEIQARLSDENRRQLVTWSHYPDLPLKEPAEFAEIIGPEDTQFLQKYGMKNSMWLHSNVGTAASLAALIRALREENGTKIAFYISETSHAIADKGALNHTPMNMVLQCTFLKNLAMIPFDHVKNVRIRPCDLSDCGPKALERIRDGLKTYKPRVLGKNFGELLEFVALSEVDLAEMASNVEGAVTYESGDQKREDEFVRLGLFQMRLLLDVYWTAWTLADSGADETIPADWQKNASAQIAERVERCDARNDAVFRELYTTPQNPTRNVSVGLLLEPVSVFGPSASLSFGGRLWTAAAGRTLRDAGYKIVPLNLPTVEKQGVPAPNEVNILFLCAGPCRISETLAENLKKYLADGGKLIWVGGSDPRGVTGELAGCLRKRGDSEVPISSKWALQNEEELPKMRFTWDGPFRELPFQDPFGFRINPNINGFGKPLCLWSIDLKNPTIQPLAWLDNGTEKFCVAARCRNVIWIPEYFLFPFTISRDEEFGYPPEMRLDSFGGMVVQKAVELLEK